MAEVPAQREEAKRAEAKRAEDAAFEAAHDGALRRAQVWFPPETPIERAKLRDNPRSWRSGC